MKKLRCVKGMHDLLPEQMPKWHFLEETYKNLLKQYGFEEIRTPILEPLDLFVRGIGEATDIVEKEMYAFEDKGGANLALRPEGTASVVRAFLQNNLESVSPVSKLFYIGPMYRRERPARGRYRQFYQAGAELFGVSDASADAEIIDMATSFLKRIGLDDLNVQLNSLGSKETRPKYRAALVDFFNAKQNQLCADCQRRLETNPLRILDCKVESCDEAKNGAPSVLEFISGEDRKHFESLQGYLQLLNIPFTVEPKMVRGLDYYTQTIFEIQGGEDILGAQATVVGGGRYNNLVKELGGRSTPTIGFAFGIERLLLLLGENAKYDKKKVVFVSGVGEGALNRTITTAKFLRDKGFDVECPYKEGSLRSQLKKADKCKAQLAVIAGQDEAEKNSVTVRDMKTGSQELVLMSDLEQKIRDLL